MNPVLRFAAGLALTLPLLGCSCYRSSHYDPTTGLVYGGGFNSCSSSGAFDWIKHEARHYKQNWNEKHASRRKCHRGCKHGHHQDHVQHQTHAHHESHSRQNSRARHASHEHRDCSCGQAHTPSCSAPAGIKIPAEADCACSGATTAAVCDCGGYAAQPNCGGQPSCAEQSNCGGYPYQFPAYSDSSYEVPATQNYHVPYGTRYDGWSSYNGAPSGHVPGGCASCGNSAVPNNGGCASCGTATSPAITVPSNGFEVPLELVPSTPPAATQPGGPVPAPPAEPTPARTTPNIGEPAPLPGESAAPIHDTRRLNWVPRRL